jgi:hypothetical protein
MEACLLAMIQFGDVILIASSSTEKEETEQRLQMNDGIGERTSRRGKNDLVCSERSTHRKAMA